MNALAIGTCARELELHRASHLVELLERQCQRYPEQTGFRFLTDGENISDELTLGQLLSKARGLAANLQKRYPAGSRLMLVFDTGPEFVVAVWGTILAGMIAVPTAPPPSSRYRERLVGIAHDATPAAVLSTAKIAKRSRTVTEELSKSCEWHLFEELVGPETGWSDPGVGPDTPCMLQYTSGSVSEPRGVIIRHSNLLANIRMIHAVLAENNPTGVGTDTLVSWLPVHHDMGLVGGVLTPPVLGRESILMPPLIFMQKPIRWLQALSRHRATISAAPSFAFELCARRVGPEDLAQLDLSCWSLCFNGAEPIQPDSIDRFVETFACTGFRRDVIVPTYGLAEATLLVSAGHRRKPARLLAADTLQEPALPVKTPPARSRRLASCGPPRLGLIVKIVDRTSGQSLPEGVVGEIWVSGTSVATSYWNKPIETAETFDQRLSGDRASYLRTGDLGFLLDSELFVTGRVKDLILIRGKNYYPQDLESTVQAAHEQLAAHSGAAFSIEVDGEERLVVVQEVDRRAGPLNHAHLFRLVRGALIEGDGVDLHCLLLIRPGSLPRTTSGKVQRLKCRELFLANRLPPWEPQTGEQDAR
jgi:acyl-CoA synthetase (AMP-forming)/AMP-acid ligase II